MNIGENNILNSGMRFQVPFPVLKKQDAAGVFVVLRRFDNSARHFFAGQSVNSICASYAVVSGMVEAHEGYVNGVRI